jgi:hypothetical protein
MGFINELGRGGSSWRFKAILLIAFGACVFMFGCKASPTWSAESRSPDGKMIATANTFEQSGFGTGWVHTTVYLNWTVGSQPPSEILAFSDGPSGPGGMNVGMKWLSPTHLDLTYKGQRPLDFQAVQCDGVDITVRDLSSGVTDPHLNPERGAPR